MNASVDCFLLILERCKMCVLDTYSKGKLKNFLLISCVSLLRVSIPELYSLTMNTYIHTHTLLVKKSKYAVQKKITLKYVR